MKRIYIPTDSSEDWRKFLAKPEKHWRSGYSAKELAECWETSDGFPKSFKAMFAQSSNKALHDLELLLAIPEHKVKLPCRGRASQNDLFVLAKARDRELVSITIEGKVAEPFGERLHTWLKGSSSGKRERLKFLCQSLGLVEEPPGNIRYQLFHRTASALLEASRFNASYAMMIVHSFSIENVWFDDYQAFLGLFGISSQVGELVELPGPKEAKLYTAWISEKGTKS